MSPVLNPNIHPKTLIPSFKMLARNSHSVRIQDAKDVGLNMWDQGYNGKLRSLRCISAGIKLALRHHIGTSYGTWTTDSPAVCAIGDFCVYEDVVSKLFGAHRSRVEAKHTADGMKRRGIARSLLYTQLAPALSSPTP